MRRAAIRRIGGGALLGGGAIGMSHFLRHERALAAVGYGMLAAVLGLALGTVLIAATFGGETASEERRWSIVFGLVALVVCVALLVRYF